MLSIIGIYLLVINIIGLMMMRNDKKRAVKGEYRIPEKSLFMIAIIGGSVGTTVGMHKYRHKTKHWYFRIGMPLIIVVQLVVAGVLIGYSI